MGDFISLIKISPENNNNRYYRMINKGSYFQIETGRVGARPVINVRPIGLWQATLDAKLKEGYVDRSDCTETFKNVKTDYKPIPDKNVNALIHDLMHYANRTLETSYTVTYQETSATMIEKAQEALSNLSRQQDLEAFNLELCNFFTIIPRKMKDVLEMLAKDTSEFAAIIERERELLEVMETKVSQQARLSEKSYKKSYAHDVTILEALGLKIRPCTEKEEEQIRKHLTKESESLFKRAFRVNNLKTDKEFKDYCKKTGAKTHYYYHGSKNANYMGIISEGLKLHSNAPITGKMFGYGLYFAPRAKKSIGYTSLRGSYWAGGHSHQAYLAVYKVAYKNERNVQKWDSSMSSLNTHSIRPYDALYAHAGADLLNDEIIIYGEQQSTIQYLIELKM